MDLLTIAQLKRLAQDGSHIEAEVHAQVEASTRKATRDGKPFFWPESE